MEVLFEDDSIVVCYKPAGLATQTRNIGEKDMESELSNYLKANGESPEIHVVHRLDQPVEGVMVFAKTKAAANNLTRQIADHKFKKHYYAIITRESFPDEGDLVDYLVKDNRTNLSKVVSENDPRAKRASLSYHTIDEWDDRKLLDIELQTGRHHQIRIQLASRTAPILGDVKYGGVSTGHNLALCSYSIGFTHPTSGAQVEFQVKPKGEDFLDSKIAN
ncbi:23S rRNA pseudouridine1911/1915/1917 synthase [Pseudobutyrivibrio sp. 49]|uniref:RluA family pseudouridine synthase n=1 Tax=unclassified Pseudobutyrivibrio TaxID=2638619 RepID=UPI00088D1C4D|nr:MULTISPECIES: RNA pseudouridine synthase [unclassified Pseudobutyrivibrio]SDH90725.1 23S rRNA pseudouridine1911/1915/1917 synthase [Pseudobutyrivibrio sp. 49]SFO19971.1 23S rRNA pseudouridine1911/1915/1917 synthase [Pseudobutyrivibrio sp. UC1225]